MVSGIVNGYDNVIDVIAEAENGRCSSQTLYEYANESETVYTVFEDTAAELVDLKNDPVFQGTNGVLTIGFMVVLLLCAVGFLIYWILSI